MRKCIYFVILSICVIFTSCQSSSEIITSAVNRISESCPIAVSQTSTINKVELDNNEIIFYVEHDESDGSFADISYQQLKSLERDPKFVKGIFHDIFSQQLIKDSFEGISMDAIAEMDIHLKAIVKGKASNLEFVCKMSWEDLLTKR